MPIFVRKKRAKSKKVPLPIKVPSGFDLPPKTQWGFCPSIWSSPFDNQISGQVLTGTELGSDVSIHHDGEGANLQISKAQDRTSGVEISFQDFPGSFFSLAFALPEEGVKSLGRQDLLRIAMHSEADESFNAYARLNLRHGPNIEQVVRMFEIGNGDSFAEFDIFYTEFENQRATGVWIDLIFNDPAGKTIKIGDPVILRRVRASL